MGKWLSLAEARRQLGLSETKTRQLIQSRAILGRFHSGRWLALRAHVEGITSGAMTLEGKPWQR